MQLRPWNLFPSHRQKARQTVMAPWTLDNGSAGSSYIYSGEILGGMKESLTPRRWAALPPGVPPLVSPLRRWLQPKK